MHATPSLTVVLAVCCLVTPDATGITVELAEFNGNRLRVRGQDAVPDIAILIDGVDTGQPADGDGQFDVEIDPFDPPCGCVITVSDSVSSVDVTVDGCAPTAPGDITGDGVVNVLDLIELLSCLYQSAGGECEVADINGDGDVNVLDLIELLLSFGVSCP